MADSVPNGGGDDDQKEEDTLRLARFEKKSARWRPDFISIDGRLFGVSYQIKVQFKEKF